MIAIYILTIISLSTGHNGLIAEKHISVASYYDQKDCFEKAFELTQSGTPATCHPVMELELEGSEDE